MNKYDMAMQAVMELFGDTSVSPSETRDNLQALVNEIMVLIESLDNAALEALRDIAEMTDPDKPENYRSDDREGCLDTVFEVASRVIRLTPCPTDSDCAFAGEIGITTSFDSEHYGLENVIGKQTRAYQCIAFVNRKLQFDYRVGQPYEQKTLRIVFDKLDEAERLLKSQPDAADV